MFWLRKLHGHPYGLHDELAWPFLQRNQPLAQLGAGAVQQHCAICVTLLIVQVQPKLDGWTRSCSR